MSGQSHHPHIPHNLFTQTPQQHPSVLQQDNLGPQKDVCHSSLHRPEQRFETTSHDLVMNECTSADFVLSECTRADFVMNVQVLIL